MSMAFTMLVSAKGQIHISASVEQDGSMKVTRVHQQHIDGTYSQMRIYVPQFTGSELRNVTVGDEKVPKYRMENYGWREDFTPEQSKNRYGVVTADNSYLIYWGLGDNGDRTYKAYYEVTNVVGNFTDCDGLDFIFFGGSMLDENNVTLEISSPVIQFSEETTPVSLVGFTGKVTYDFGKVVIEPQIKTSGLTYVKVQFPKGTFTSEYKVDQDFAFARSRVAQLIKADRKSLIFSVSIDVNLLKNGDARITEIRQMVSGTEGTEGYITFNNMGSRKLKDFSVTDDVTGEFVTESEWNVERSRSEKQGKCGINETGTGYELCWGLGSPGLHTYVLSYTITDLVRAYKDFDGFNHSFYEAADPAAHEVVVRIHCEMDSLRAKENARVWAFGYEGTVKFEGDGVMARSERAFEAGESIIVMMQFSKGLFVPQTSSSDSFVETVKKQAFEGSDYDMVDEGDGSASSFAGGNYSEPLSASDMALGGTCILLCILPFILPALIKRNKKNKQLTRLLGTKKLKEVQYYQQVPLGGNLLRSRIIKTTMVGKNNAFFKGLIEAFILRLIYRNEIAIVQERNSNGDWVKLLRINPPRQGVQPDESLNQLTHSNLNFKFMGQSMNMSDESVMYCLQQILYDAAGPDHLLQPNELKDYVSEENKALAVRPFARALQHVVSSGTKMQYINGDEAKQVVGFWNYLNDFTLANERTMQEVTLWKEYLVFASVFDIAEQVRRDMKQICPDYTSLDELTRSLINDDATAAICHSLTSAMTTQMFYAHNYETAQERLARIERERRYERSSGGGGRSSYGGGGGHSGGGGSGVR